MTKVVVLEKFKKNWEIGSVVTVKDGYARNYLIPNGKAKFATKKNIEDINSAAWQARDSARRLPAGRDVRAAPRRPPARR